MQSRDSLSMVNVSYTNFCKIGLGNLTRDWQTNCVRVWYMDLCTDRLYPDGTHAHWWWWCTTNNKSTHTPEKQISLIFIWLSYLFFDQSTEISVSWVRQSTSTIGNSDLKGSFLHMIHWWAMMERRRRISILEGIGKPLVGQSDTYIYSFIPLIYSPALSIA